jgi:hypothetical protein
MIMMVDVDGIGTEEWWGLLMLGLGLGGLAWMVGKEGRRRRGNTTNRAIRARITSSRIS